jgi:hypothetical protein
MSEIIQIGPEYYADLRQTDTGKWFAYIIALDEDGRRSIEEYTDTFDTSQAALDKAKEYWRTMYGPLE